MEIRARIRRVGSSLGVAILLSAALASTAGAAGSFTQTLHSNSLQMWGSPFTPVTSSSGCSGPVGSAFTNDFAFLDLTGNGVQHVTVNGAGDSWFTSTFTGSGTVTFYPASSVDLTFDSQGNITSATVVGPPDMVLSAHVTEWFGFESNRQNAVGHGTVNGQGTSLAGGATVPAGLPVSIHVTTHSQWAVGADPSGPPSFMFTNINC